jgi:hypothetical protein
MHLQRRGFLFKLGIFKVSFVHPVSDGVRDFTLMGMAKKSLIADRVAYGSDWSDNTVEGLGDMTYELTDTKRNQKQLGKLSIWFSADA